MAGVRWKMEKAKIVVQEAKGIEKVNLDHKWYLVNCFITKEICSLNKFKQNRNI